MITPSARQASHPVGDSPGACLMVVLGALNETHSFLRCANTFTRLLWLSSVHLSKVISEIPADQLRGRAQRQPLSCFQGFPCPRLWHSTRVLADGGVGCQQELKKKHGFCFLDLRAS